MTALEIVLIILIILFIGGIVGWRVWRMMKNRKAVKDGKSTGSACGCGCSGCAQSGCCPSAQNNAYSDTDEQMPEVSVLSEVTCDFKDIAEKMNKDK